MTPLSVRATVTAKGQVTLRRALLDHIGAGPGSQIDVSTAPGGKLEVSAAPKTGTIEDFIGSLKRPGQRTVTIEEMNETIEMGWAGLIKFDD